MRSGEQVIFVGDNDAVEIQEQYMRMYQFDYKRANCSKYDFDFVKLD